MDFFELKGENGYVRISLVRVNGFPNQTSHFGGYETECEIEIKSQSYFVKGVIWTTTGEVHQFFKQLENFHTSVSGTADFENYEHNLKLKVVYSENGQVNLIGEYQEFFHLHTQLIFEIKSDQSYLSESLVQLKMIVEKYGNSKGLMQ